MVLPTRHGPDASKSWSMSTYTGKTPELPAGGTRQLPARPHAGSLQRAQFPGASACGTTGQNKMRPCLHVS